jgi:hypothetical protein
MIINLFSHIEIRHFCLFEDNSQSISIFRIFVPIYIHFYQAHRQFYGL